MSPLKSPLKSRRTGTKAKISAVIDDAKELLPGWSVEVKRRKATYGKKTDRFYTDPVTGRIFRSLIAAQRYLKTGELGKSLVIRPKNSEDENLHMEETRETLRRKRPLGSSEPPPETKTRKTPETGPSPPAQSERKTRKAKRASGIKDIASRPSEAKTCRATRQAGDKVDTAPPSPLDTRNSRQPARGRAVNLTTPKENDKKVADVDNDPDRDQEINEIETGTASALPPPERQPPPTVVHRVDHVKQESPETNPTLCNPIPQDQTKTDSSISFSMDNLWTDPCIEFAVKTLTGAIPVEDLNKAANFSPSPLKVPPEELWTDPCIEFAVKTLTGAIPVGEDDYTQHRPSCSLNPHASLEIYLPDASRNSVDSMFGNGGLQSAGNVVTGSNGQGSRSRFLKFLG